MRTTLTLDDRLFKELKTLAVETNAPFKEVVNRALRAGVDSLRGGGANPIASRRTTWATLFQG